MKIVTPKIFNNFPEIVAGVSTKDGGVSAEPYFMNLSYTVGDNDECVKKNRELFFEFLRIPVNRVSFQKQTHSSNSNFVSSPAFFQSSDALYTNIKNNYLAVSVADCIPILLYEPQKKVISAVHSGWKGTASKILTKNIITLKKDFDIDFKNLYAFVGPGVSQKNFETEKNVADLFRDEVKICRNGKYLIDLKKDNLLQLLSLGIKKENIELCELCTYKEREFLHSYRRDRDKSGRMIAVIGMR
jgi:polyphenol oxidase